MTPAQTGGKRGGNFEIDRIVKGRRIRFSIGNRSIKRWNRFNGLIDKLIENDQFEILEALAKGEIAPGQLLEADRGDRTKATLADVKLRARLWDRKTDDGRIEKGALSSTLPKMAPGPRTRKRYHDSFVRLQRKAPAWLDADATVGDLADVPWSAVATAWGASAADWMHLRRAVSRFLTIYLGGKIAPFRHQVLAGFPAKKVKKRRPNVTVGQFLELVAASPPHAAAAFWVLAVTGMRVGEYLACTREHVHARTRTLHVPGTKTEGSDADIEVAAEFWGFIEQGIPSRIRYKWLHNYWKRACVKVNLGRLAPTGRFRDVPVWGKHGIAQRVDRVEVTRYEGLHIHDLRHCTGQWAIDAGVDESKVQALLRHEHASQTRDYVIRNASGEVSKALVGVLLQPNPNARKEVAS
jgi:integrase